MLTYEMILTYEDGTMKKERATLPAIMAALAIYMEDDTWHYAEITNCLTDDVLAQWVNYRTRGVTSAGA